MDKYISYVNSKTLYNLVLNLNASLFMLGKLGSKKESSGTYNILSSKVCPRRPQMLFFQDLNSYIELMASPGIMRETLRTLLKPLEHLTPI